MAREVQIAIDCIGPDRLASFWADFLGYEVAQPPPGYASWAEFSASVGQDPGEGWSMAVDPAGNRPSFLFHRVPEPKVGKNRLHLDIGVAEGATPEERAPFVDAEAQRLAHHGATHIRTGHDEASHYAVMHDPDGNEFCVSRLQGSGARSIQVALDCDDPDRLAGFWTEVLQYRREDGSPSHISWADPSADADDPAAERWSWLVDPLGEGVPLLFHRVAEPKVVKNRVHLDVRLVPGGAKASRQQVDDEARRLVGLGADHVRTDEDESDYYAVMQDPEGNEFCID